MEHNLSDMRRHYEAAELSEENTPASPYLLFNTWFSEATASTIIEPNAMTLATASREGKPSARIVLLKEINKDGFVFYTNYQSKKAKNLEENPAAAVVFLWDILEKQVRVEGRIEKIDPQISEDYFYQRPIGSQIGAIISPQSQKIATKDILLNRFKDLENSGNIKKPDHWGGYVLIPEIIEFWQGRPNRLHDRIVYELISPGHWGKHRLAP
jgi:pyridoxamine 5'-phosphate oxidase